MNIKQKSKEELENMTYDEIAYLILEEANKKMKLVDLFNKVCKYLQIPEETVQDKLPEFFEILSINKKFVLLKNGYWDLAIKHQQDVVIEDEEDEDFSEEISNNESELMSDDNYEEDEIFYDDNEVTDEDEEDDLKDLVIIDSESEQ